MKKRIIQLCTAFVFIVFVFVVQAGYDPSSYANVGNLEENDIVQVILPPEALKSSVKDMDLVSYCKQNQFAYAVLNEDSSLSIYMMKSRYNSLQSNNYTYMMTKYIPDLLTGYKDSFSKVEVNKDLSEVTGYSKTGGVGPTHKLALNNIAKRCLQEQYFYMNSPGYVTITILSSDDNKVLETYSWYRD